MATTTSHPEPCARVRDRLEVLDALPRPGSGGTRQRWLALADLGREDLSVTRIAEGHVDAQAIVQELGRPDLLVPGQLLGVWAAEPAALRASPASGGWRLHGTKRWCSGSRSLDGALVTATAEDGVRLFALDPQVASSEAGSWLPMGMAATVSDRLTFDGVDLPADAALGEPGAYVDRPGFGHGGCGVAACWWGGALGVADGLTRAAAAGGADDVAAAIGRSVADLAAAGHALRAAAAAIDARPHDLDLSVRLAAEVRLVVERAARTVLDRTVAALGAAGLCQDPVHSGRVADLFVYLSQHHRLRAEASLGRQVGGGRLEIAW